MDKDISLFQVCDMTSIIGKSIMVLVVLVFLYWFIKIVIKVWREGKGRRAHTEEVE